MWEPDSGGFMNQEAVRPEGSEVECVSLCVRLWERDLCNGGA